MTCKTKVIVAASLLTSVWFVGAAQAGSLYQTDFENPPFSAGDLVGQDGWVAHSGTGSPIQVISGASQAIELVQGGGSRQDANVDLGVTLSAGGMLTFSFDIIVNGTDDAQTSYFAHLRDDGTGFNSRVFVTAPNTATQNFTFGIGETSSSTPAATFTANDFAFGQLYSLSGGYDFDTGISFLTIAGFGTIDSTSQADPGEDISTFAFRQSGGNTSMIIDNLNVSMAVVPAPAAVWLLGSALFGMAGLKRLQRRKG